MKKTVFISYRRNDFPYAEKLYDELVVTKEYQPWLDVKDIPEGSDWQASIDKALENADYVVLLVSPWALHSANVKHEYDAAIEQNKQVLCVLIQTVDYQDSKNKFLPTGQWIDIRIQPLKLGELVLAWLYDASQVNGIGKLPSKPKSRFEYQVPPIIHFASLFFLGNSILTIVWLLYFFVKFVTNFVEPTSTILNIEQRAQSSSVVAIFGLYLIVFWISIFCATQTYSRKMTILLSPVYANSYFIIGTTWLATEIDLIPELVSNFLYGIGIIICLIALRIRLSKTFSIWNPKRSTFFADWHSPENEHQFSDELNQMIPLALVENIRYTQIGILFADADRRFGKYLMQSITKREKMTLFTDLSTWIELHKNSTTQDEFALVVIFSPWLTHNHELMTQLRNIIEAKIPTLPIMLEETKVPTYFYQLDWVYVEEKLRKVAEEIGQILLGETVVDKASTKPPTQPTTPLLIHVPSWADLPATFLLFIAFQRNIIFVIIFSLFYSFLPDWSFIHLISILLGGSILGFLVTFVQGMFWTRRLNYEMLIGYLIIHSTVQYYLYIHMLSSIVINFRYDRFLTVWIISDLITIVPIIGIRSIRIWSTSFPSVRLDRYFRHDVTTHKSFLNLVGTPLNLFKDYFPFWSAVAVFPLLLLIPFLPANIPVLLRTSDVQEEKYLNIGYDESALGRLSNKGQIWEFDMQPGDVISAELMPLTGIQEMYFAICRLDRQANYGIDELIFDENNTVHIDNLRLSHPGQYALCIVPTSDLGIGTYQISLDKTACEPVLWLGVSLQMIDEPMRLSNNLPDDIKGVMVTHIQADSPAESAGLIASTSTVTYIDPTTGHSREYPANGDIILSIDNIYTPYASTLADIIVNFSGNDIDHTLTIWRDGEILELQVTLAVSPDSCTEDE